MSSGEYWYLGKASWYIEDSEILALLEKNHIRYHLQPQGLLYEGVNRWYNIDHEFTHGEPVTLESGDVLVLRGTTLHKVNRE